MLLRQALIGTLCFLAGLISAIGINSLADNGVRLDAAMGQCRYSPSPDGMWWQRDEPHSNRYKTNNCFQPGIHFQLNPVYGINIRYVDLGTAKLNALAWVCDNDDCTTLDKSQANRQDCKEGFAKNCLARWTSQGGVKGVSLSADAQVMRVGQVGLEAEAGVLVYQAKWHAQVTDSACNGDGCPWSLHVTQRSSTYASPLTALYLRWHISKDASVYAGTQIYWRTAQHTDISPGINGRAQTWIAGLSINL